MNQLESLTNKLKNLVLPKSKNYYTSETNEEYTFIYLLCFLKNIKNKTLRNVILDTFKSQKEWKDSYRITSLDISIFIYNTKGNKNLCKVTIDADIFDITNTDVTYLFNNGFTWFIKLNKIKNLKAILKSALKVRYYSKLIIIKNNNLNYYGVCLNNDYFIISNEIPKEIEEAHEAGNEVKVYFYFTSQCTSNLPDVIATNYEVCQQ